MKFKIFNDIHNNAQSPVSRLIVGDEMDVAQSKISSKKDSQSQLGLKTGTIGFCDFHIDTKSVPAVDSESTQVAKECLALRILALGIEPEHKDKNYSSLITNVVKEIGVSKGCTAIWHDASSKKLLDNKYRRLSLREIGPNHVEYIG